MGNLTNQYVSQSYQGLLKLDNSNTGVTATLQYVTDGLGNKIPMQVSTSSVVITGSFRGDGSGLTGITVDSGSLVTTSSFNAYTSSNDSRVNSLIAGTGSYATTSSLTALSQSIASTDLAQNNRLTSIESITGSLATTASLNSYTLTSSFNSYTSSANGRLNSLESATGSLQNQINQKLDTGSFNSYTSSNDGKVNSLIAATASYVTETESGSFLITGSASGNVLTFTKGNGTQFNLSVDTGSNSNRNGLITTGSAGLTQQITGSLNVEGTISATSASFTYINTVYETASVIYSSGSNQFGDASNDTQTLWGTVNLPSGPLVITGSVTSTDGFNGNLTGTASFATNALSASQAQNAVSSSQSQNAVSASQAANAVSSSYATNALSASYAPSAALPSGVVSGSQQIVDLGFATTSSVNQKLDTGSFNSYTSSNDGKVNALIAATGSYVTEAESGSFMTTGSVSGNVLTFTKGNGSTFNLTVDTGSGGGNRDGLITTGSAASTQSITGSLILSGSVGPELDVKGDVIITGSVILSGSAGVELDVKGDTTITGSLGIRSGSLSIFSQTTTINTDLYLTNSLGGQSNIIQGWNDNAVQSNHTGSLRITGSNNIVSMPQLRATAAGGGVDVQGYVSGSGNMIMSNQSGIYMNTGSLLFPKTQNNILGNGSSILMNFTTSSLAGGHPVISNNLIMGGQVSFNSNSGSIQTLNSNAILGGGIASTQNFVTNTRPSIVANNVIGQVTLNHISSSINYLSNYNNSPVTINNHLSSSIVNNSLSISNNTFLGGASNTGVSIWVSGSQSSNVTRTIVNNLIGGSNIIISSSFVGASNSNLVASLIYGNGLTVSGSHTSNTNGGSAFLGRFNDTGSLSLSQDIVFAVGTGQSPTIRRTSMWITTGSLVAISGSLDVKGPSTLTGSVAISGSVNISGETVMSSSLAAATPLYVSGTIQTQRLQFDGNPFNASPATSLAALRYDSNNEAFSISNYNKAQLSSGSVNELYLRTGSNFAHSKQIVDYAGTSAVTTLSNSNGSRTFDVNVDRTTITGSLNVTGSVSIANAGDLTMYGHKMFNVGAFVSTQTQSGSANVSQSINYNTTDYSNGVSVVSGSRLTVANAGVYNIQFSVQVDRISGSGTDTVNIWLKKNGTNVTNSAGAITIAGSAAQAKTVSAWNYVVDAAANDYYELVWQTTDANIQLINATATGNIPDIPSAIVTVTQAR